MAISKVLIVSNAFVLLGKGPIQSIAQLDTGNVVESAASTIYDSILPGLLSERPWRFALKQFNLNRLSEKPMITNEWSYIYQLPSDYLSAYRVYPNTQKGYAIYDDKLYSNSEKVYLEYMYSADETKFTPNFTLLLTYSLAANIAMTVTQQVSLAQLWEKKREQQMSIAAAVDALSMPNTFIQNDPLYSAHVGY